MGKLGWDDVQQVDVIGLEVGYRLIPLVDQSQGGELLNRILQLSRSRPSQLLQYQSSTQQSHLK